jgi:1-acyl-sn-glycerol-3-phosphate acyltransferase
MKIKPDALADVASPQVATRLLKGFSAYSRHYVLRHFHAIWILKNGLPPSDISCPVVIYLNHASWWDPLVCLHLARKYFAERRSFAPIDAASLQRYGFFKQLGFYGIEQKSARGAMTFLRTTCTLLGSARNMVWLTPQGRFMDVRQRPLRLQHGLGSLAARLKNVVFVPLAIEYTFWTESRPEILLGFGRSSVPRNAALHRSRDWTEFFSKALEDAQDELAAKSSRRDPADWIVLDKGKSGISAICDSWRWLRSRIHGGGFVREHNVEEGT